MIDQAIDALRHARRAGQQRRHPARPHAGQHDRGGVGRGDQGAPEGHLRARRTTPPPTGASWSKQGQKVDARIINTTSVSGIYGNAGQTNYGAAKAGIAGVHHHRRARAAPLRHHRQRHRARRADPPDRGPRHGAEARDEDKARMHPRWIAPIVTWLASTRVGGRHAAASSRPRARCSPSPRAGTAARRLTPVEDPSEIGPIVDELMRTARKNAGMDGQDLD